MALDVQGAFNNVTHEVIPQGLQGTTCRGERRTTLYERSCQADPLKFDWVQ